MNQTNRPVAIFLVGVPLSGKSTFVQEYFHLWQSENIEIISRDNLLLKVARTNDYSKAWDIATKENLHKKIDYDLMQLISNCVINQKSFLVDMTNLRYNARAEKLSLLSQNYIRVAIIFPAYISEIEERNIIRKQAENKYIPVDVLQNMTNTQQLPSDFSGEFHIIWRSPHDFNYDYCKCFDVYPSGLAEPGTRQVKKD